MNDYEWLLSISIAQHDASITLLRDGELVLYIPEERISRDKHDSELPLTCLSLVKKYTNKIDKLLFCKTTSGGRLSSPDSDLEYVLNSTPLLLRHTPHPPKLKGGPPPKKE